MTDQELHEIAARISDSEELVTFLRRLLNLLEEREPLKEDIEFEYMTLEEYVEHIKSTEGYGAMKAFAERTGMTTQELYRLLRGNRPNVRLDTMLKIQKASGGRISRIEDFVITRSRKKQGRPGRPKRS